MSLCKFYRYKNQLVIPTIAQSSDGLLVEISPVLVGEIADHADCERLIALALTATPENAGDREQVDAETLPVMLSALGLRHWHELEKNAHLFTLYSSADSCVLHRTGRKDDGFWCRDDSRSTSIDLNLSPEEKARVIASLISSEDPTSRPIRLLGG